MISDPASDSGTTENTSPPGKLNLSDQLETSNLLKLIVIRDLLLVLASMIPTDILLGIYRLQMMVIYTLSVLLLELR